MASEGAICIMPRDAGETGVAAATTVRVRVQAMAEDFKKMRAAFDKMAKKELSDFSLAESKKAYKALEDAYKVCLKFEDELIALLPGARANGVNGDDIRSFLRDPAFKKKYKEFDSAVDKIDAAEKRASTVVIQAGFQHNDLKVQKNAISRAFPNSKDKEVLKLLKDIDESMKEMDAAAKVYEPRGRDKKMHEYATKFEKKIEKILELAPPSEKPEEYELPKELDGAAFDRAKKDVAKLEKDIEGAIAKIGAYIANAKPYSRGADRLVEKERNFIESTQKRLEKLVLDYDRLIKDIPAKELKELRGKKGPDIQGFQLDNHKITRAVKDKVRDVAQAIAAARKTLG